MPTDKFIVAIGTICAVTLGWVLSQISQWVKGRKSENRVRKKVLFLMLEIYYSIPKLSLDENMLIDKTISRLYLQLPMESSEEEKKMISEHFSKALIQPIRETLENRFLEINKKYEEAVSALSAVNPLLAYKLTNQGAFLQQKNIFSKSLKFEDSKESDNYIERELKQYINGQIDDTVSQFFKEKICQIAFQISLFTWINTKLLLKGSFSLADLDEEMNKSVDEYCSFILKMAIEATGQKN